MIIIFKNKGILVPVYLVVSLIGVAVIVNLLKSYVGGIFLQEYDMALQAGIAFIIAAELNGLT